jgi:hypothetical protein
MATSPNSVQEEVLNLLPDARVRPITWGPDATHIFQELHVNLFGRLK